MKKLLPLVLVLIALLIGIGVYLFGRQDAMPSSSQGGSADTAEEVALPQAEEQGSMIASIKDAMGLGQAMQCTYTGGTGDTTLTSKVSVSGEKFRSESEVSGTKVYALFDGDTQYTWMGDTKQGTKMSKACLDELQAALPETQTSTGSETPQPEDYSKMFDAANNVNCVAAASGADFSVPADITFTDQCEMMKESLKMMEQFKGKLPDGMNIPGY